MPQLTDIARSAYNAYGFNRNWKTHDNKPMPQWSDLRSEIKIAWMCAAQQAIDVSNGGDYGLDTEKRWAGVSFNDGELI